MKKFGFKILGVKISYHDVDGVGGWCFNDVKRKALTVGNENQNFFSALIDHIGLYKFRREHIRKKKQGGIV
jgi:hypothetical protein